MTYFYTYLERTRSPLPRMRGLLAAYAAANTLGGLFQIHSLLLAAYAAANWFSGSPLQAEILLAAYAAANVCLPVSLTSSYLGSSQNLWKIVR